MGLTRLAALANRGALALGIVALAALPLIVFYDVLARYLFNAPTVWATEVSIYIQQLLVFLPMGLLLMEDTHIRSTLLTDHLPARWQRLLYLLSVTAVAVLAVFITWLGWTYTVHSWQQHQVSATLLAVPLWIPNALIPLGGALLLFSALATLLRPPLQHRTTS